jgi:hypothetical protein
LLVPPTATPDPTAIPVVVVILIATFFNTAPRRLSAILLALQLRPLRLLLHHRITRLLRIRGDTTTRQNKCRRREHQNVLLHFQTSSKTRPIRSTPYERH